MKKPILIIGTILTMLLLILVFPLVYSLDELQLRQAQAQIERNLDTLNPTYTNVETTIYFTPDCRDTTSWCSPEKGDCFTTRSQIREFYAENQNVQSCLDNNAGWCCIPTSHRGFYEEVKCQGSGVCEYCSGDSCNPRVYYHDNEYISTTQADSTTLDSEFTRGITRTGTNPTPKWTVAVNTRPGTPGYIPDGTLMYIYFGRGHPWNGIYKAEDTGSAFQGQAKIDIYAGVGREARDQALADGVSGQRPLIYFLDSAMGVIEGEELGIPPTRGEYKTIYSHTIRYDEPKQIFERARSLVETASKITSVDELDDVLKQHNYSICQTFEENKQLKTMFEIADCTKTRKECYCKIEVEEETNITQTETQFILNDRQRDTFFRLEMKDSEEFQHVFNDEIYIFSNQTDKLVSKQELEEDVDKLIEQFEDILQPSNFLDGIFDTNFFSQIPFLDQVTGFLSPTGLAGLGINMIVNQNFNLKEIIQIPGLDYAETLLNPEWLLDPDNEEETIIEICTAPQVHYMVCDDLTDLDFVIYLESVE